MVCAVCIYSIIMIQISYNSKNEKIVFPVQCEKPTEVYMIAQRVAIKSIFVLTPLFVDVQFSLHTQTHTLSLFLFLSMCNFSQPQKQTDLQTHNEWITFTSFHFLWTLKTPSQHIQHTYTIHTYMCVELFLQLLYRWIANLAASPSLPPHPSSFHLMYSMAMGFMCLYLTQLVVHPLLSYSLRTKSLSIKLLNYIGWSFTRSVLWLFGRSPISFLTHFALIHQFAIFILILFTKVKVITRQKSLPITFRPKLNRFGSICSSFPASV